MLGKLLHIVLASLVLISSTGLLVNRHFCQNELQGMSLFVEAQSCHPKMMAVPCPVHGSMMVEDKTHEQDNGCCQNESEFIQSEVELQTPPAELQWQPELFAVVFAPFAWELSSVDVPTPHYLHYKPPLLVCDRPVSLQTFLC